MNTDIKFSLIDVEKKYHMEIDENAYGSESIISYGKDNDMPVLLKNCYRNSATLKSVIDGSVNYILGDDITVNESAAKWKDGVNRSGMTMRQFISNLAMNHQIYGGFAVQVIFNKLGQPVELYPLDFGRCRTNENHTKVWYSRKKWGKYTTKADCYDAFNPTKVDPKNPTQIFYYAGDFTSSVYPLPPYYGALKDVLTEMECANYSLNSVSNGFAARYIFNIPDSQNLTDEQKRSVEQGIKEKFCGSEADANFMLYWKGDAESDKIDIAKIEGDTTPERYIAIKDNARANIFVAMRATPNLFGLPSASTGFNQQEYSSAMKLYQKSVIEPIRDVIKEAIDKMLGVEDAISIAPYIINFNDEN